MSRWASGFLAFTTSAAVLVMEIIAGRLLAPYVGVTLQTYTAIIGTVLAGISLGAWLGGRIADRPTARHWLGFIIIVGGALIMASLPILRSIGPNTLRGGAINALALAAFAFLAPAIVLSMVSPILVKLTLSNMESAGRDVGRISALSTAGAIVGSFVSGFLLEATIPSSAILLSVGSLLVVLGIGVWFLLRPNSGRIPIVAVLIAVAAGAALPTYESKCETETAYFCAKVTQDPKVASGRYLILDGVTHSYVDLNDPTYLKFEYVAAIGATADVVRPKGEPIRVLHVGGGGFTLPRYVRTTRPNSTNLVLERDRELTKIGEQKLGLNQGDGLEIISGDARVQVRKQSFEDWDLVVGDAFSSYSVPWHLATKEYTQDVSDRLKDDGIFVQNAIDEPPLRFIKSDIATIKSVFPNVALAANPEKLAGKTGGNFIVLASRSPLPTKELQAQFDKIDLDYQLLVGSALDDFIGDANVLTDDFAPVDLLITSPV